MRQPTDEPHPTTLLAAEVDELERLTAGTSYADAVHRLLTVARTHLRMRVAWVSEFVGGDQVLRFVDAEPGADAPVEGSRLPLSGSFCARVLDGRFPRLIPNTREVPDASLLDVTAELHIGAYVGVPLLGATGAVTGMLCAVDGDACPALDARDVTALQLLAQVLHDLQQRAVSAADALAEREALSGAVDSVLAGHGRSPVLQPIIDLTSGTAVAAEGLTRFSARSPSQALSEPDRSAAQWFDDAARLGRREELELVTAAAVLDLLALVPAHVSLCVNLGPDTLLTSRFAALLDGRDLQRVVVEVTEHAPVHDYPALTAALQPYRQRGLRLAVDDVGAGYASLRHVLSVSPDLIKIDMALTRGADGDMARRTLLKALAAFAHESGCRVVAEGVETPAELDAVAGCGIDLVQGYALARPSAAPSWDADFSSRALVP